MMIFASLDSFVPVQVRAVVEAVRPNRPYLSEKYSSWAFMLSARSLLSVGKMEPPGS